MFKFPEGFLWGCATSAHQIEGGLRNDWSEWENSEHRKNALIARGKNPQEFLSGKACESYIRDNADIDCVKQLGVNAYRFSLDWSRIEPEKGVWNTEGLEYYRQLLLKLRAHNIEPFVTLWHWPVPLWVRDQGGWTSEKTADDFAEFTEHVVEALGDLVHFWVTLNEPQVYTSNSYITGEWPPQKKSIRLALRVVRQLIRGHKKAYAVIKAQHPDAQVGIASHNIHFDASPKIFLNSIIAKCASEFWNHYILRRIRHEQDFVGVNFYFTHQLHFGLGKTQAKYVSDIGWDLKPESLFGVLAELKRYAKPVYILEHGLADREDRHRSWYMKESLRFVHRAIASGVDVRGYFHWSLLDNFEWAMGFDPCFGLFSVDFATCIRTPRPSVAVYREIIARNGVD